MPLTGNIVNIARSSVHDGHGIRTVVYFKGCGLRCRWCHNPETFSGEKQILYAKIKCIHCGRCLQVCPEHHRIAGHEMVFEREGCRSCGRCTHACPSGALSVCGGALSVEDAMREIRKDAHFFEATGGGVTLSGGECLLQPDYAAAVLSQCRQEKIHTMIESALFVPWENIEWVIPYVDGCFVDLKLVDAQKHRFYTGQDNRLILENIRRLSHGAVPMVIRIPLIPGVNDSPEDMRAFAGVISALGEAVQGVELLRYNNLAEAKYQLAGLEYEAFGQEVQSSKTMEVLREALAQALKKPCEVFYRKD